TLSDTITVSSADGTATQLLTITITGTNDTATIGGAARAAVGEATTLSVSGALTVGNVDTGEAQVQPIAAGTVGDLGYGTFEVQCDGSWTDTHDNPHSFPTRRSSDLTLSDTITVSSADGTATQLLTITITGTNDTATIG